MWVWRRDRRRRGRQHVHGRQQGIALDRACSRIAWPVWRSCSPQRRRGGHAAVRGFRRLGTNRRVGPLARNALFDGWRQGGVAQGLQASPGRRCACGHRPTRQPARRQDGRRLRPAHSANALRRTRPAHARPTAGGAIAGHVRVPAPTLEDRKWDRQNGHSRVRVERQRETTCRVAHLPGEARPPASR